MQVSNVISTKPSLKSRAFTRFKKYYTKQIDGTGLAVFRIVFCTVQLAEILQLFYFRHLIYDAVPFVETIDISFTIPLLCWAGTTVLLIFGLFTRVATILNYLFTLIFLATAHTYAYHMFYVYQCLGFLFMFLPIAQCLSLDRLLLKLKYSNTRFRYNPPQTVSQLAYYTPVIIGIAFVYFDSTFFKFTSSIWIKGLGMWAPASLALAAQVNSSWLLNNQFIVTFMGYLAILFEFLFLFLFPFRRYRAILMVIGIGLHVGILVEFPIPMFAIGFGSIYLLMVPVGIWRRIFARQPGREKLTFYYDAECPLCARTRLVIEHLDPAKAIRFRSVQAYATQEPALAGIPEEVLLDDVHSVDKKGRVYSGVATYAHVLSAIGYLSPLSWLIRTPGIYQLATAAYRLIAHNRTTERCTEDTCGYEVPVLPPAEDEFKILRGITLQNLKVAGVAAGLFLLIILQCLASYNTPVVRLLREKSGLEATLPGRVMNAVATGSRTFSTTFLGITNHGVFLDEHFANYNRIVAVTYTDGQGVERFLPITRESGQPGAYQYGPLWCKWAFIVVGNHPKQANLEKGIRDFTAFWAGKNGVNLTNCRFQVKVKHLASVTEWQRDFLNRQLAQPWQDAGTVLWKDNKFYSELKPINSL